MEKLEEDIGDSVRPKNKFETQSQGESIQDSCKTSNDVRCRDVGSEESTREEVGCGGNEDVKAKLSEISSDTHQLHYTPKHHFIIIIIIIVDTVFRQKRNFKHEKQLCQQYRHIATKHARSRPPGRQANVRGIHRR